MTRHNPVPMDATMATAVSGLGSVTATLSANTLTITGTFGGLKSPATNGNLWGGLLPLENRR
jgi:hypothetical protein